MKMHGGKFGKEFAKKTIIADFFQCKLDLILVSLQLFRQTKKEFFLLFIIIDCLSSLMVPKLGQFNEFEISVTRLTLSWNCPDINRYLPMLNCLIWYLYNVFLIDFDKKMFI